MQRLWHILSDTRVLILLGFAALAAFLFIGADQLEVALIWAAALLGLLLLVWLGFWLYKRWKVRRAAGKLENVLEQQASQAAPASSDGARRDDVNALRQRMLDAINTIKTSKLGQKSGAAALYELPWYMVIGNPAAGKSTAIANSGLQFPFADKGGKIVHGVGGTRNCDWFFTTDGILLDTAGRYSVYEEDRNEWFSFLGLLKRYRKQAPINGIIIAVSIAELTGNRPEFAINLAKNLRQRVQELTEKLEVFAPVYVVFTKADLITGFNEFFLDTERGERDRVWGATLAYDRKRSGQEVSSFFDERFDELYAGLKEMSLANMSVKRGENLAPGVLTFPLEFSSIKGVLRSFVTTLFEENPFQFKPVFRGFYFTSALQEGATVSASSQRIADRFGLTLEHKPQREIFSQHGFFLHNLFKQVIFADKQLVAQYTSRNKIRMRYITFFAAVTVLGALLGGWSWSYMGNRQLVANVQADMDKAVKLQEKRLDLQSRFEALEILQDRIEQLDRYRSSRPISVGLGLYQGDLLERKLREEYFAGIKEIMLKPVSSNIETYLMEVNANSGKLEPMAKPPQAGGVTTVADNAAQAANALRTYKDSSATSVEDAYNALKTYLMLSDKSRAESSHLSDQITRFWRGWLETNRGTMPREQMIRSAERLISFSLEQINDPSWPTVESKLTLVDQTRENLRRVVRGMPARERVYADVKARAATRFASMTVARIVGDKDKELVMGSYAIPGTFTRDAWEKFVQDAFKEAANKELQSADWVLKTSTKDDLTLEGSPEQIQKALVSQYKTEYAREWQKFLQGVSIVELRNLDDATNAMNRLGDPLTSPLNKVINTVYDETSWDNPSLVDAGLANASKGFMGWFKETILRRSPAPVPTQLNTDGSTAIPMGPVGREFAGVARLVVSKDKGNSLMRGYMENLSKLRTRLNTIKNQGDTGPGAKQLMQQTLEGNGSELSDSLKFVDEEMLPGLNDQQKTTLRPLLVRPLVQGFNALVRPTEGEVNKIWRAQVYEPFQNNLAAKYPFSPNSKIEANSGEIGTVFGENGAISKFVTTAMGPLVVRRGDTLSPRKWADMGITLSPAITTSFADWISAPGGAGAGGGAAEAQTVFQIQPQPAPGALEYTIEIDGQQLRYRNTQAQWTNFVWPNPQGAPGAKVTAVTYDGRTVEVANQPGRFGLERLINTAQRKRKDNGAFELSWTNDGVTVVVNLKIISSAEVSGNSNGAARGTAALRGLKLPETIAGGAPEAPTPAPAQVPTPAPATAPAGAPAAQVQSQTQSMTTGAKQ
ncbi:type VI secretion system membrane subunit TssM [Herbaspirillum huttiense F1]|uniref:Type VI secretion system membrane subunit TssM n=3 Tax=Pseudomonadota TaxID=1224 RepID=A0ABU2EPU4_9BURK|nr:MULTISPECIES: type VI secretion system membrane subunit TssM [Herbaspirillum]MBP1317840.1 type VI secretion system protein ImpL [Herbaspirillum sp. 1130]MDR9850144.1 type VI secretion system membrane subunit TssM [Herbaspirillum huttiense SE1]MDT0358061.1 type VI secretion system membrane subunit TssM [Herbaspirillum huttiense F1]